MTEQREPGTDPGNLAGGETEGKDRVVGEVPEVVDTTEAEESLRRKIRAALGGTGSAGLAPPRRRTRRDRERGSDAY